MSTQKKLILVIGATGAQGTPVIKGLLAPSKDGSPSPYAVRALTRDPENRRAKELKALGCEIFQGNFCNLEDIKAAYRGCYGVYVNTDTATVGMEKEIFMDIKLWEYAHYEPTMRHFIYSGLDYTTSFGEWSGMYTSENYDAKGAFGEYLKLQKSELGDGVAWTNILTGPYMEMLSYPLVGPLNVRADGTVVFAHAMGDGHVPLTALQDIAWWARYSLDNREKSSGQVYAIASDMMTWDRLAETFTRVTGIASVHKRLTVDEWVGCMTDVDRPVANQKAKGDGSTTIRTSYTGMMTAYRHGIIKRDMDWVLSVHPDTLTFEKWVRKTNYDGRIGKTALKNSEDGKARLVPNREICDQL